MTKLLLIALLLFSASHAVRYDKRRPLDSLNTIIENIRTNQAGYRTSDDTKKAMVELPGANLKETFRLIDNNGKSVYEGDLTYLGDYSHFDGTVHSTTIYKSITPLYEFKSIPDGSEYLYEANFGDFKKDGEYRLVSNGDTSYPFELNDYLYNDIMEKSLHFFGIQRSGDTESWFHPKSHTLDGSARGADKAGSLAGGWYDCGDHFKVAQTTAYSFTNLTLSYLLWPEKAEDRYGHSYAQTAPHANDGIPDILWEAKIGADYIYKLYLASKEDGLIEKHDMYQQVGVDLADHMLWILPEYQDYAPREKGGPDRVIDAGIGADMGGQFAGTLALFASAWKNYDSEYADKLLEAAIEIYEEIVLYDLTRISYSNVEFYTQQTRIDDDIALGALGLWYATKDPKYKYDLLENPEYGEDAEYGYDGNEHIFKYGMLASNGSGFYPGGWVSDYQNIHAQVAASLYLLIYRNEETAKEYGIEQDELEEIQSTVIALLKNKTIAEGGSSKHETETIVDKLKVEKPYNLRWTSSAWGFNRYNMGAVTAVALAAEILFDINDPSAEKYQQVVIDNLDYALGKNPWNISFIIGAGDKHLQHIHHRGANPDGYNAGGIPYEYREPTGAFMGSAAPGDILVESFDKYTITETCIDYSSQLLFLSQQLSKKLPPDKTKPELFTIIANPVEDTIATIRWDFNELTNDTVALYIDTTKSSINDAHFSSQSAKTWELHDLKPDTQYWISLVGKDIAGNSAKKIWFSFTTTEKPLEPTWEAVDACNVSHEAATVAWWSPGQFGSSGIYISEDPHLLDAWYIEESDFGSFHQIMVRELEPNTTYYYDRVSGSHRDDNEGNHYSFKTRDAFVDYSIYIKPVNKARGPTFYLNITNNEQRAYADLELRLYLTVKEFPIDNIKIVSSDKQIFDMGGTNPLRIDGIEIGDFVAVDNESDQYYLPIRIKDEIPIAGRAELDITFIEINEHGSESPFDINIIKDSWAFNAHEKPLKESGISWDMMDIYTEPFDIEVIDGAPRMTYDVSHYIPVYYKGSVHVYGYAPDFKAPLSLKSFEMETNDPFFMDANKATLVKDISEDISGSVSVLPYGDISDIEINGEAMNIRTGPTVDFKYDITKIDGFEPMTEFVAWSDKGSEECSYTYKKWLVDFRDEPPSSSEEEPESSDEIESSDQEIEYPESSSEEASSEEEEPIHFDPPQEVLGGDFTLLFEKNLYISEEPEFVRDENITLEEHNDRRAFTIEVSDIPAEPEEYTLRFVGTIYSLEGLFIEEFDITMDGDDFKKGKEYSFQWNNRDVNGNLLDQEGRPLGSGVYLMNFQYTLTGPTTVTQTQMFLKMGYLRMF
ncbi:MAG: glycoside hydrolase family 9 protein [Fibrobacterales bacterium]